MVALGRDITFACRSLRGQPGYAAAVVVLMAPGIGATTAAFSTVNGLLWIRSPYRDARRTRTQVSALRLGVRSTLHGTT